MSAVTETKIERVVEAVESLATAVVAQQRAAPDENPMKMENVCDARKELRTALADFLRPALRIVDEAA
jgi:hypothetical protein